MSRLVMLALMMIPAASVTSAQNTTEPQTVRFTGLSWVRLIDDIYVRDANGEKVKLWIPNGSPSKEYEVFTSIPVRFLRESGVGDKGMPIEEVVGTYTPAKQGQLLIFVANKADGNYRILPIDFSQSAKVENEYRFVNLSSFPVYVKFGDDRFKIPTKSENSINATSVQRDGLSVAMAIQVSEQPNDAKIAYSSVWTIKKGRSALIFITTDTNQEERIDVKRIYF